MAEGDKIDVAVIGVGRMGRHHARIYAGLDGANLVAVVDADDDRAGETADRFGCADYETVDALLDAHPDLRAVTVAVPTLQHVEVAGMLLERGIACLVEKPLAPTTDACRALIDFAQRSGATLAVGHTERFNPAVRVVTDMHITPRFIEVDRVSPMTFRSLDIGVVMDMMIHDLDLVLMFADSPIKRVDATGVAVLAENEDVANARLLFENGCVANLTASRLALKTHRKMRLFSEAAYVSLDYHQRSGVAIRRSDNEQALVEIRSQIEAGADLTDIDYSELVNVTELDMEAEHDPLTGQLQSFLHAVATGDSPAVDGAAGMAAVDAAERVVAAIKEHTWAGLGKARV